MKNLYGYNDFCNEDKKEKKKDLNHSKEAQEFNKDVKNLLNSVIVTAKNIIYKYDNNDFAVEIKFKVDKKEYDLDFSTEDIVYESDDSIIEKRDFLPVLSFVEKNNEDSNNVMVFKIRKEKIDKEKIEKDKKDKSESVKNITDSKLLSLLKSKKVDDSYKEKIMDELDRRDIDYDDPFNGDELTEKEIEKLANKEAKKKKKKITESAQSSEEYYKENRDPDHIEELLSEMGFESIMSSQYPEEFENSEFFSADMTDEEYANAIAEYIEKNDKNEDMEQEETIVEGLVGKIAKLLSKTEYNKTLDHVKNSCEDDCTKEDVKACVNKMVFSKITKKELSEDSILMNSLVDELYKDFKKDCEKCESFGTPEWAKKYGVVLEEEKKEYSLEYMINESLNIKPEKDQTLEDIFNQIYEEHKQPRTLETIKKENK